MLIKGALTLLILTSAMPSLADNSEVAVIAGDETLELVSDNLQVFPQWVALLKRAEEERAKLHACEQDLNQCQSHRLIAWLGKLHSLEGLPHIDLLHSVNRYVNSYPLKSDSDNYRLDDYWASPLEFLENGGDDEDVAVMKYFMLREQGVPTEMLRITLIEDSLESRTESVLQVEQESGDFLVLSSRQDLVQSLSGMRYSTPVYSVNESRYWLYIRQ